MVCVYLKTIVPVVAVVAGVLGAAIAALAVTAFIVVGFTTGSITFFYFTSLYRSFVSGG